MAWGQPRKHSNGLPFCGEDEGRRHGGHDRAHTTVGLDEFSDVPPRFFFKCLSMERTKNGIKWNGTPTLIPCYPLLGFRRSPKFYHSELACHPVIGIYVVS